MTTPIHSSPTPAYMSATGLLSDVPPAYSGSNISLTDKETELETQVERECTIPDATTAHSTCAEKGHNTRPSAAELGFIAATWPGSLLYLHFKKKRTCRRCKEIVERKSCCAFS